MGCMTAIENPLELIADWQLLDRGIGKAAQPIVGQDEGPVEVRHIVSWIGDDQPKVRAQPASTASNPEDPLPWQH
jgi:hypothetical protein